MSYVFQIILQQTYGESDHPWKLRAPRFHAVASSLQGWNRHRRIGSTFYQEKNCGTLLFARLPLGTWRWKEQELLR